MITPPSHLIKNIQKRHQNCTNYRPFMPPRVLHSLTDVSCKTSPLSLVRQHKHCDQFN
jgi:hypothetical protein